MTNFSKTNLNNFKYLYAKMCQKHFEMTLITANDINIHRKKKQKI